MYWITFLASAVVIIFAGIELTRSADTLSDRLHLGKTWIGIVLLGFVTSLPEAITSIASIVSMDANDLAIGNLFGSNNFNPMLLVVMDFAYRRGAITNDIEYKKMHKASAFFAASFMFLIVLDMFLLCKFPQLHLGTLSYGTLLICVFYFLAMRYLASIGKEGDLEADHPDEQPHQGSLGILCLRLLIAVIFIVGGAIFLANSADMIAEQTGLGRTFVGSIFLALVTSLPEMVVTLSALKLGQLDLAIGNIFGSNMTNLFIVFVCDAFQKGGAILNSVSITHIFTAMLSIVLVVIAISGIKIKKKQSYGNIGLDSLIMLALFITGTALLYQFR